MAATSPDRSARVAGALCGAFVLAALGVLLTPGGRRGIAALVAALGLLAGAAIAFAGLLPARRGGRTLVERLNDAAFVVVLSAVSLLLAITARPWTAALPGLVGGLLAGRVMRRPAAGDADGPPDRGASPGSSPRAR
jgi:hypothetical protein